MPSIHEEKDIELVKQANRLLEAENDRLHAMLAEMNERLAKLEGREPAEQLELRRLELEDKLGITVLPMYRGSGPNGPVVDKRATFILQDGTVRNWTVMVKMNVAAVEQLIEQLQ